MVNVAGPVCVLRRKSRCKARIWGWSWSLRVVSKCFFTAFWRSVRVVMVKMKYFYR